MLNDGNKLPLSLTNNENPVVNWQRGQFVSRFLNSNLHCHMQPNKKIRRLVD